PPSSRLGPITPDERRKVLAESPVAGQYDQAVDRDSAFEILQKKTREAQEAEAQAQQAGTGGSRWTIPGFDDVLGGSGRRSSNRQTVAEAAIKSVVRSVGSSVGRAIVRGILGSLARGR
ncbi:helicase HerA-like domain-containing protein, partial [Mesorhizobium sp.]